MRASRNRQTQGPLTPGSVNWAEALDTTGLRRDCTTRTRELQPSVCDRVRAGAREWPSVGNRWPVPPKGNGGSPRRGARCQPGLTWSHWSYNGSHVSSGAGARRPLPPSKLGGRRLNRSSGALPFGFRQAGARWRPTLGVARRHADQVCVVGAPRSVSPRAIS